MTIFFSFSLHEVRCAFLQTSFSGVTFLLIKFNCLHVVVTNCLASLVLFLSTKLVSLAINKAFQVWLSISVCNSLLLFDRFFFIYIFSSLPTFNILYCKHTLGLNIYDDVLYNHIGTSLLKITVLVTRFAYLYGHLI